VVRVGGHQSPAFHLAETHSCRSHGAQSNQTTRYNDVSVTSCDELRQYIGLLGNTIDFVTGTDSGIIPPNFSTVREYLTKMCQKCSGLLFCGHSVYMLAFVVEVKVRENERLYKQRSANG